MFETIVLEEISELVRMAITFEINAALGIPQDLDWFEFQKLAHIFHSWSISSDTLENFLES